MDELMDRYSAYHNLEEIHDFLDKLNKSKNDAMSSFEIVPQNNDKYIIHAKVTNKDWDSLNLECWFW